MSWTFEANPAPGRASPSPGSTLDLSVLHGLSVEEQALVRAVRGDAAHIEESLDWDAFTRLAIAHDIAPLLHTMYAGDETRIPPWVISTFSLVREQARVDGERGLRDRDEALEILAEADIPYLVLKGTALARRWYGDVSLRPFADIDLLVPPAELDRARATLMRAGYRHTSDEVLPHDGRHETPLRRPGQLCPIELHYVLTTAPPRGCPSFEELSSRAVTLSGPDSLVHTLGPEDTLIYLCVHMLQHFVSWGGWRHSFPLMRDTVIAGGWRLSPLCDVSRHVAAFSIDPQLLQRRAQDMGVDRACRAFLGLAALILGEEMPIDRIDESDVMRLLRQPTMLQTETGQDLGGAGEVLAHLSRRELRRAVAALLFTPGRRLRDPRRVARRIWHIVRRRLAGGEALSEQIQRDVSARHKTSLAYEESVAVWVDFLAAPEEESGNARHS